MADRAGDRFDPGTLVIMVLGALTIVEYLVAVAEVPGILVLLLAAALAKAYLIVRWFMHVGQLRRRGGP